MVRNIKDGTMASVKSRIHCIGFCTGYGDNTSIGWVFFTHHVGFETIEDAVRSLSSEFVARYKQKGFRVVTDEGFEPSEKMDPMMFIAFVNSLLRGSWGDYGDPDKIDEMDTKWWPFTDVDEILSYKKNEIVTMPMLGAEVMLAAIDPSLLTEFDVREVVDNLPKVAEALGIKAPLDIEDSPAIGVA